MAQATYGRADAEGIIMEKESPGAKLKKIRLQKGLSLEEVHRRTKIHINILKAIEEDSVTNISPVYIKGFLKIYCKFLGVDPKDYIPDYREPQVKVEIMPKTKDRELTTSSTNIISTRLAYFKKNQTYLIKMVAIAFSFIVIFFILFRLSRAVWHKRYLSKTKPKTVATTLTSIKEKQQKEDETAVIKSTVPSVHKPEISKSEEAQIRSGIRLTIRARDDCWIQVRADGKIIFQSILKKGRSESWQAKDKIELSLGNAGVVELEVNGNLFTNLGRKGQALKNITITKEGLVINQ